MMAAEKDTQKRPIPRRFDYIVSIEHSFSRSTLDVLQAIADGLGTNGSGDSLEALERIEQKIGALMATQAEFQAKIDNINANTTASAAAAESIKTTLDALREQILGMGLSGEQEAALLAQLDQPIATSAALKTFLEATASGPVTEPEPEPPVVEPEPPAVEPTA